MDILYCVFYALVYDLCDFLALIAVVIKVDKGSALRVMCEVDASVTEVQSVSWSLAEFRHNKIVQSPHENYFNVCRQHKEK